MMMKTVGGILFSLVTLALLGSVGIAAAAPAAVTGTQGDAITLYSGSIGPGNSLYGLRIAFENLDESFTFNQSEKLEKQVLHADLRLAELKQELADNSTETAEIALEHYRQKLNQTEDTLTPFPRNDTGTMLTPNDTGLLQACAMITKHQQVLEDLLESHPDNRGLARAYNNSIELEQKFKERMEIRIQHQQESANGSYIPLQNMTPPDTGRRFGHDSNMTMPIDGNPSWNKEGLEGNFTGNFPPGTNQSMNRNGQDPNGQAGNRSAQDLRQQQGNTAGNAGNNQNGNTNNNQNIDNNTNQNTNRNNNNTMEPANGGGNQNINSNRNTGSVNSDNSNGNTHGNTRSPGR